MRWQALLALPILALAACKDDAPARSNRASVLIFTPKVPGSVVIDTTGTEDAERLTMIVPVSGDSVARYFRTVLGGWGWELMNDRSAGDAIDLYARKGPTGNSTLWIHIERQDTLSARYTMIANTPVSAGDTSVATSPPASAPAPGPTSRPIP